MYRFLRKNARDVAERQPTQLVNTKVEWNTFEISEASLVFGDYHSRVCTVRSVKLVYMMRC